MYYSNSEMEQMDRQRGKYMLLGRLQSDCEVHLHPEGTRKIKNTSEHIQDMKDLWVDLVIKPEWISFQDILDYENRMKG